MPDSIASYEQYIEAGRLALGRGDRAGAEQALRAAIRLAEQGHEARRELAAALIRLGELKRDEASLGEAEELFRRALDVGEKGFGSDDVGLVPALTSLGAVRIARGVPEEAEPLLTRALSISERRLGRDHPDLVVLLNDLSRLYIKQSAPAFAEPLLLRLYAIKRAKGEEHPEVATVLASLATVRQALGRHDAAEQLWRRVLAIRERTLAPNHFAVATAIEHLGETCAARGKLDEALRLFQRSLAMREITLGAGHASLRILRERIADLQLQAEEESLSAEPAETRASSAADWQLDPPAEWAPSPVAEVIEAPTFAPPVRIPAPEPAPFVAPPIARTPAPAPVAAPEPVRATVAAAEVAEALRFAPPPARPASTSEPRPFAAYAPPAAPPVPAPAMALGATTESQPDDEPAALRLLAVSAPGQPRSSLIMPTFGSDFSLDAATAAFDDSRPSERNARTMLAAMGAFLLKRPTPAVAASAGAVVLVLAGLGAVSHSRSQTELNAPSEMLASAQPLVESSLLPSDSMLRVPRAANGVLDPASETSGGSSSSSANQKSRSGGESGSTSRASSSKEQAQEAAAPAAPALPMPNVGDLSRAVPGAMTAHLDSVMRAVGSSQPKASITARDWMPRPGTETVDTGASIVPARMIGALPRAPYPDALRTKRIEGNVVVEFYVDTTGHPDMGTLTILESNNEQFTASVRKVIPFIRFVPAQEKGEKVRARVRLPFAFALNRE